jgi:hypothetical protein
LHIIENVILLPVSLHSALRLSLFDFLELELLKATFSKRQGPAQEAACGGALRGRTPSKGLPFKSSISTASTTIGFHAHPQIRSKPSVSALLPPKWGAYFGHGIEGAPSPIADPTDVRIHNSHQLRMRACQAPDSRGEKFAKTSQETRIWKFWEENFRLVSFCLKFEATNSEEDSVHFPIVPPTRLCFGLVGPRTDRTTGVLPAAKVHRRVWPH